MGAPATEQDRLLAAILGQLSDFSAASNGAWRTLTVDNIVLTGVTAPTSATQTSTSVSVRGASRVTVYMDITGATTGVLVTVLAGVSGFGMLTVRSATATAGLQSFTVGDVTTGATVEYNGITRFDDIAIQMRLSANTGASTGVLTTLRTRFLTEP